MRIALIDDDKSILEQLSELIAKELTSIGDMTYEIHTFCSGEDFLATWQAQIYDLIVLDIYMKQHGLLGIDVARKVRETDDTVAIAFCTTSNEFAAESYEVDARYYLQKPISTSNVTKMFQRLNLENMEINRTITLANGQPVFLRKILYTEYTNHIVTFYMKDKTSYHVRTSQKELENLLLPYGYFCSPNKGLLVNLYEVNRIKEEMLVLSDGTLLPISRRKQKDVKDLYINFCFSKMRKEVEN